jgi:hypothetical protein
MREWLSEREPPSESGMLERVLVAIAWRPRLVLGAQPEPAAKQEEASETRERVD